MTAIALPRIGTPEPKKRFPIHRRTAIDGNDHYRGSSSFSAHDKRLRHFPLPRIDLKPDGRAACCDHVFDRRCRPAGENLEVIANPRRIGDRHLSVRVKGAVATGRCDHDPAVIFRAEDLDGHVDCADIDEPARAQLKL
jgi:hypothetical protein